MRYSPAGFGPHFEVFDFPLNDVGIGGQANGFELRLSSPMYRLGIGRYMAGHRPCPMLCYSGCHAIQTEREDR
jgi:hypothetical protein